MFDKIPSINYSLNYPLTRLNEELHSLRFYRPAPVFHRRSNATPEHHTNLHG